MQNQHQQPLLSLPQLPLLNVIKQLDRSDKRSLAGTCRSLARLVSQASAKIRVIVTSKTGWEGLQKVLAKELITCTSMALTCAVNTQQTLGGSSALGMLLSPVATTGDAFHSIKELSIAARPIPCLLPPNLASMLPNLDEVFVSFGIEQFNGLHPIGYCRTLRKIRCLSRTCSSLQLPDNHHTHEDLRRQLPNVMSLDIYIAEFVADNENGCDCADTMLQAWGDQLTELEVSTGRTPINLQHCTRLQSLGWFLYGKSSRLPHLPLSLSKLRLSGTVDEFQLPAICELPSLMELSIDKFIDRLQQDWSKHPCSWKQLTIGCLHMVDLSKLPLHSLKGQGCLKIKCLNLPNPLLASSLADVQHAAQCVSDAGITIEGLSRWEEFRKLSYEPIDPTAGEASAALLRAASRVVKPMEFYYHYSSAELNSPGTATAIIEWASHSIRSVSYVSKTHDLWFWQALQSCCNLVKIKYSLNKDSTGNSISIMNSTVQWASTHITAVTRKHLKLEFEGEFLDSKEMQVAAPDMPGTLRQKLSSSVYLQDFIWEPTEVRLEIHLAPRN